MHFDATNQWIHFVTGRLAEHGLRREVESLAEQVGFRYSIDVLPISVAALLTPQWIAPRIRVASEATCVLLPGYCHGDLSPLEQHTDLPIHVGPKDFRELAKFFGKKRGDDYGDHSIEIIAEINHAPRLELTEIVKQAKQLSDEGADIVDVGCEPGITWPGVSDCVTALRDLGLRVSIDSFDPREVEQAVAAGAELVLSVNSSNRRAAVDWGCEVVVIPDEFEPMRGLDESIDFLTAKNVSFRIDPILEPIGCGFARSLGRYIRARTEYPDCEMMMGIGNLSELTDVDSAGVNVMLLGICEELGIRSVLTTQVINWARSSVRECDIARRLVHYAVNKNTVPKHIEDRLVMLRDTDLYPITDAALRNLQSELKDPNYRIFAENGSLYAMNVDLFAANDDPFLLFADLMKTTPKNIDASHAFYLGYELSKAVTALTLGKQYRQDESLDWGFLTREEKKHRNRKRSD